MTARSRPHYGGPVPSAEQGTRAGRWRQRLLSRSPGYRPVDSECRLRGDFISGGPRTSKPTVDMDKVGLRPRLQGRGPFCFGRSGDPGSSHYRLRERVAVSSGFRSAADGRPG